MIQLLDCDLAQQTYEERLRKAERNRRPLVLTFHEVGPAPISGASARINQIKRWLSDRPRREVTSARHLHTI